MGAIFEPFFYIIELVAGLYMKVVIIEVVLHWLIHFGILELNNKICQENDGTFGKGNASGL